MIVRLQSSFGMKLSHANMRLRSTNIGHGVSAGDMRRVEEIWRNLNAMGKLPKFEGTILNALDITEYDEGITIECGLMLYRCLVARSYENLSTIKPVAVSGFVEKQAPDGDAILLGLRSEGATTHPGWYEMPPSGGLEIADVDSDGSINIDNRLLSELFEETRIERSAVKYSNTFGLFYDDPTGTVDIIVRLGLSNPTPHIDPTNEYSEFRWATRSEILALMKRNDVNVVDVSRWISSQWLSGHK